MSRRDDGHGDYPSHGDRSGDGAMNGPGGMGGADTPVDLAAVQADEALLNMLGAGQPVPSDSDAELTRVLVAWRRDVESEPFGELVDPDSAVAAIGAGRRSTRRRHPLLGTVAAAAAMLVIAFSGVGLVAKSAQPGDQLWGVTKVLYSDYARSVEAAKSVSTELQAADVAIKQGKPLEAKQSLERAQKQLAVIAEAEGRTELATQHQRLELRLEQEAPDQAGSSTNSSDPLTTSTVAPQQPVAPPPAGVPGGTTAPQVPASPAEPSSPTTEPSTPPTTAPPPSDSNPDSPQPTPRSAPPPPEDTTQAPVPPGN